MKLFPGNSDGGNGYVTLNFEEGEDIKIPQLVGGFSAIVDVLRHDDKTIWFEDKNRIFRTGTERPADLAPTKVNIPKMPKKPIIVKDRELERVLK